MQHLQIVRVGAMSTPHGVFNIYREGERERERKRQGERERESENKNNNPLGSSWFSVAC